MDTQNVNVQSRRGSGIIPPYVGVIPNVFPEVLPLPEDENLQGGVFTSGVRVKTLRRKTNPGTIPHCYAIRCTYGRERKAYELFSKICIESFCPTIISTKIIDVKTEKIAESRIPNILLAYGSFNLLKKYVYENGEDTKYLRFYYNFHHDRTKEPLIIPQWQMDSLMKICEAEAIDKQLEPYVVEKFKYGQFVRVTDGPFAGVEGIVKRYKGQQRVGIVIDGSFTIITAYVAKDNLNH